MKQEKKDRIKILLSKLSEFSDEQKEALVLKLGIMNPEQHILSPRNQALLMLQNPDRVPTVVAGFRQWLKYGRCVKRGQKGSLIAVPSQKKNEDEIEEDITSTVFFLWKTVFDISQTYEIEDKIVSVSEYEKAS